MMREKISAPAADGRLRLAQPAISCIVPALNEHDSLTQLLPRLAQTLGALSSTWEIILVDDGSTDETPQLMAGYSRMPGFRYLRLSRNFGKEAAISAGLTASTGDVVLCMDADLQHPLELVPEMFARWQNGADNVYAVRANRDDERWLKSLGSRLFYGILGQRQRVVVPPDAGDFRLMDRKVVDALLSLPERTRFMKGLYAWVGFDAEAIPYVPAARAHGATKFSAWHLVRLATDGITAFSTWPLRVLSTVGLLLALLSFFYGSFLVVDYFRNGNEVSGWTTIVTALFFFSGLNFIALGIIGAYIGRIFDEVKQRPLYIVRESSGVRQRGDAR